MHSAPDLVVRAYWNGAVACLHCRGQLLGHRASNQPTNGVPSNNASHAPRWLLQCCQSSETHHMHNLIMHHCSGEVLRQPPKPRCVLPTAANAMGKLGLRSAERLAPAALGRRTSHDQRKKSRNCFRNGPEARCRRTLSQPWTTWNLHSTHVIEDLPSHHAWLATFHHNVDVQRRNPSGAWETLVVNSKPKLRIVL